MTSVRNLRDYVAQTRSAPMPQVVLLCGMTGSGKTTVAFELERALPAIRFSVDEWMIELYGHHMAREAFDERQRLVKGLVWGTVERLVALRVHVVLDFGFWRAAERAAAAERARAAGGEPVLVFLNVPARTLQQRLARRNADLPHGTFEVTGEMLTQFRAGFEVPSRDEGLPIIELSADEQAGAR